MQAGDCPCNGFNMTTRLKIYLIIFIAVMVFGTYGFMLIENKSLVDSAYFVIVTMATVGYGDIHPVTTAGKGLAVIIIVLGIGTFLGVVSNITEIMLAKHETKSRMQKLNMVIGVFFSEVGIGLLEIFSHYDPDFDAIRPGLTVTAKWSEKDFHNAITQSRTTQYGAKLEHINFPELKTFLMGKRDFMVRLLENPVLLEHEGFTDLLRAVFHLTEELTYRRDFATMPQTDSNHLAGDIKRSYHLIVSEWLVYMRFLKNNYPFLFSLAIRTNPFDPDKSVIVKA